MRYILVILFFIFCCVLNIRWVIRKGDTKHVFLKVCLRVFVSFVLTVLVEAVVFGAGILLR